MTRSMPNISSSGNISPQSITTMSSPYSKTYMFLPISPTPPSGMMRSGWSGGAIRFVVSLVPAGVDDQKRSSMGSAGDGGAGSMGAALGGALASSRVSSSDGM